MNHFKHILCTRDHLVQGGLAWEPCPASPWGLAVRIEAEAWSRQDSEAPRRLATRTGQSLMTTTFTPSS